MHKKWKNYYYSIITVSICGVQKLKLKKNRILHEINFNQLLDSHLNEKSKKYQYFLYIQHIDSQKEYPRYFNNRLKEIITFDLPN